MNRLNRIQIYKLKMTITMIILAITCWILAVATSAIRDVLAFKFKRSKFRSLNPHWWSANTSWRNKYLHKIPKKGPKFLGSTTFFAFTTDAWSMFNTISTSLAVLAVVFSIAAYSGFNLLWCIGIFLIFRMGWVAVYHGIIYLVKTKSHGNDR